MNGLSAWHNFITESHHESWVMECQHVGRAERTQMPHQAVYETEPFYRKQATRCLAPLSGYQASLHPPWMCVRVCLSSWTTPCNMEVDTELNTELFAEQLDWYVFWCTVCILHVNGSLKTRTMWQTKWNDLRDFGRFGCRHFPSQTSHAAMSLHLPSRLLPS